MRAFPFAGRAFLALFLMLAFHSPTFAQGERFLVQSTPLPHGRAFHGSAVLGDYLYVFSGFGTNDKDGAGSSSVLKARIGSTGLLGEWTDATSLPSPRHYIANSTLVLDDVVYILGGANEAGVGNHVEHYNTCVYTRPLPNGTLLPWTESRPFEGAGVVSPAAVSTPGHLHLIGGKLGGNIVSRKVWTVSLYADGSLAAWEPGPDLPEALWFHHAGVAGGRVYVWGGLTGPGNDSTSQAVFSAAVLGSGRLGSWRREPVNLPGGMYSAASAVAGPYLFTISPRYQGGSVSNDVWWTYVTAEGIVPWRRRQTSSPIRVYHCTAMDFRRGRIYVPGGKAERASTQLDTVLFLELSQSARELAEQGWTTQLLQHSNTVSTKLPPAVAAAEASGLTFSTRESLPAGAVGGFVTVGSARSTSAQRGLPMVMYFNIPGVRPCKEQESLLDGDDFRALVPNAAFAWADTSAYPQLAQQLGVFRVPTWIVYDKGGRETVRLAGVVHPTDLAKALIPLR